MEVRSCLSRLLFPLKPKMFPLLNENKPLLKRFADLLTVLVREAIQDNLLTTQMVCTCKSAFLQITEMYFFIFYLTSEVFFVLAQLLLDGQHLSAGKLRWS